MSKPTQKLLVLRPPDAQLTVDTNACYCFCRNMMKSELESKARRIHEFYDRQWNDMVEDRIYSYRQMFIEKGEC